MPTSRPSYRERIVPIETGDGRPCNLVHVRGERGPHRGPVLLVHGAGVRAEIFRAPIDRTLVDALIDEGYDVWLENWRASIDFPENQWTLDQAAVYDHPAAVRRVVAETGHDRIKAVVHCQGSASFFMAAVAGLTPAVTTIVSNAVSLHPVVPILSMLKVRYGIPLFRYVSDYMNPQWGLAANTLPARFINLMVRLTHHECRNMVCKHVSFTYGAGFPSLWSHAHLSDETHEWIRHEFAFCPVTFFLQMARSIKAGRIVAVEGHRELPADVLARPPETDARMVFLAGAASRCFLPASQTRSFEYFDARRRNYHALYVLPTYGHLDVFIGKHASRDVFPIILRELNRES
jgi:pimeloyl-ACP methyl ester carboxylesterase